MNVEKLLKDFKSKKALIIGDAMIDAYMWGEINRTSPEAPVNVVNIKKHENRLGGAANVALNIKSLGSNPILCSVIGDDKQGVLLKNLMQEAKLSTQGILTSKDRKTTLKTRVIADNKHQIRIDEEDTKSISKEKQFLKLITKLMNDVDVIILQDYNKGVLTNDIITNVIKTANIKKIPTIVDPKKENFFSYKDCTVFKPNLVEIKEGMNIDFNVNLTHEIEQTTRKLRLELKANAVLLTLSEKGICINSKDGFIHTPAIKRKMIDVSGAGDTVLSMAALCLASDLDFTKLSKLSSLSGGIVCEEAGVVAINKEKLIFEAKKHIL